jgi:hypothetical protein
MKTLTTQLGAFALGAAAIFFAFRVRECGRQGPLARMASPGARFMLRGYPMHRIGVKAALLCGIVFASLSVSAAQALPVGTGSVTCLTETRTNITDPVSCNGGADSGLVTYAPFAGVSGRAFGQGLTDSANVLGVLNYSFEVTGGTPGTVVPVDINTVLKAIPISIGIVFSEIDITANTSAGVTICNTSCGGETSFIGTLQVSALSGAVNTVHLEIEVGGARGNQFDFDGGMASADPYIYIAPTFPNADDFSIEVSPNIGNVPATPLPAALPLFATGLGALGLCGWRRKRKAQAIA